MSLTRLIHDKCSCDSESQDNKSVLGYALYLGKFENSSGCTNGSKLPNVVEIGARTDVESDLQNNGVRLTSKCASNKFPANSVNGKTFTPHLLCEPRPFVESGRC